MVNKPDGCGLSGPQWTEAQAEYSAVAGRYRAALLPGDGEVQVHLQGDKPALWASLQAIIAREAGCCPFLHFQVDEVAEGYHVRLTGDGLGTRELLQLARGVLGGGSAGASEAEPAP